MPVLKKDQTNLGRVYSLNWQIKKWKKLKSRIMDQVIRLKTDWNMQFTLGGH